MAPSASVVTTFEEDGDEFYKVIVQDTEMIIPRRYQNLQIIGFGAQGMVCSATDTACSSENGRHVAIKKLLSPFRDYVFAKRAYRELTLMNALRHPNVIRLYNTFTPQKDIEHFRDYYLVMELMDGQLRQATSLDMEVVSYLLYQLLCGLKYLQSGGILHRDLKPSNIGVKRDCTLRIMDFGIARRLRPSLRHSPYVQQRFYRAPEIILGMDYDEKGRFISFDIWSVGCILAELFSGHILFPGIGIFDQWGKIIEKLGTPSFEFMRRLKLNVRMYVQNTRRYDGVKFDMLFPDRYFPPNGEHPDHSASCARDLLSKMLVIDPRERISIQEALQHPYVNQWYNEQEANVAAPQLPHDYEDEEDFTVEEWKRLTFDALNSYESEHDIFGPEVSP
ncbi:unnamed protein product [Soboliphyme baturini]|uniref:Stress-activated protein kinase JNK n=1 Tax=Soboliphyme baturini TaxID=241478 RepID=A0A183IIP3_9BILA|nr:unnamed protein product [Soboliphyme baturini]